MEYKTEVFSFLRSSDFKEKCKASLPGNLTCSNSGLVILAICLDKQMMTYTRNALLETRKSRNPELFARKAQDALSSAEENSEVNRFVGWAIFSLGPHYQKSQEEHKMLQLMQCRVEDLDEAYLSSYYDPNMAMLNTGGLTLVRKEYFQWGRNLVAKIRGSLNQELLEQDPIAGFAREKEILIKNKPLLNHFKAICRRCSDKSDLKKIEDAAGVIHKGIVEKVVHARFGVEFKRFKFEKIHAKDGIALRNGLKVISARSTGTKKEIKSSRGKKETPRQEHQTAHVKKTKRRLRRTGPPIGRRGKRLPESRRSQAMPTTEKHRPPRVAPA